MTTFGTKTAYRHERIAHDALSVEDVLFVVLTDRAGEPIRISRPRPDRLGHCTNRNRPVSRVTDADEGEVRE
jgi:sensor histidine kinase regulating citrate/malate metabolism